MFQKMAHSLCICLIPWCTGSVRFALNTALRLCVGGCGMSCKAEGYMYLLIRTELEGIVIMEFTRDVVSLLIHKPFICTGLALL